MLHSLDAFFLRIAMSILAENKTTQEWAEIESSDMFQENNYIGGFDATEMEFCFSVYVSDKEYWFQVSLDKIKKIVDGEIREVDCRLANSWALLS